MLGYSVSHRHMCKGYEHSMITIRGKLIDPWHVELTELIPRGANAVQIHLADSNPEEAENAPLLTRNPAFDFLRDEPDLYE